MTPFLHIKRYLRLYAHFLRFSFSKAMEFRMDFFFRIFMDCMFYAVNIAFFKLISNHTDVLGGWNEKQIMVFTACFLFLDALNMTIFSNNIWTLPSHVNKGDLDYYIVRPVSSLFFLSLREFAANSFINLLMAVAILAWAILDLSETPSIQSILLLVFALGIGQILHYCIAMIFTIPVLWTHSGTGFGHIQWILDHFMERPDRIFFGPVRIALTTILPYCLMVSYPVRLFLEGFNWEVFLHLFGVTVFFFLVLLALWRVGLRSYSSASS